MQYISYSLTSWWLYNLETLVADWSAMLVRLGNWTDIKRSIKLSIFHEVFCGIFFRKIIRVPHEMWKNLIHFFFNFFCPRCSLGKLILGFQKKISTQFWMRYYQTVLKFESLALYCIALYCPQILRKKSNHHNLLYSYYNPLSTRMT